MPVPMSTEQGESGENRSQAYRPLRRPFPETFRQGPINPFAPPPPIAPIPIILPPGIIPDERMPGMEPIPPPQPLNPADQRMYQNTLAQMDEHPDRIYLDLLSTTRFPGRPMRQTPLVCAIYSPNPILRSVVQEVLICDSNLMLTNIRNQLETYRGDRPAPIFDSLPANRDIANSLAPGAFVTMFHTNQYY